MKVEKDGVGCEVWCSWRGDERGEGDQGGESGEGG